MFLNFKLFSSLKIETDHIFYLILQHYDFSILSYGYIVNETLLHPLNSNEGLMSIFERFLRFAEDP